MKEYSKTIEILAVIVAVLAFALAFVPLTDIGIQLDNHGFVAALLSLSSLLLFYSALRYQIREYKLQYIELKNSVEAQTKSSKALEDQKDILLDQKRIAQEQKLNELIFHHINAANDYCRNHGINKLLINATARFYSQGKSIVSKLNKEFDQRNGQYQISEFSERFLSALSSDLDDYIYNNESGHLLSAYFGHYINLLHLIEKHQKDIDEDYFKSFLYTEMGDKRRLLFYFSATFFKSSPPNVKVQWNERDVELFKRFMNDSSAEEVRFHHLHNGIFVDVINKRIGASKSVGSVG
jgi:hypothetical protein